jgi:hypothetical protein
MDGGRQVFGNKTDLDKELRRAEKSARRFAAKNAREAKEVNDMFGKKNKNTTNYSYTDLSQNSSSGNPMLQFFIGFLLLGGGLYWLFNSFTVAGGFGFGMRMFGMHVSGGVMLIPLMLGIGLIFFLDGKKRFIGYMTAALGLFVIVISLLNSLEFRPKYGTTLYVYVIIFAMIASGAALMIKSTMKKKS